MGITIDGVSGKFHYSTHRQKWTQTQWFKSGDYFDAFRDGGGFLRPYLGTTVAGVNKAIPGCPARPDGVEVGTWSGAEYPTVVQHFFSLGLNYLSFHPSGRDINLITQPESYIIYADSSGGVDYLVASDGHFSSPEDYTLSVPSPRHEGRFNGAFLDGHVDAGTLDEYYNAAHFIR